MIYKTYVRYFNSHAHVERDDEVADQCVEKLNFNSHAHVERDEIVCRMNCGNHISTHTLTWSVTAMTISVLFFYAISTHTLTWSVT